MVSYAYLPKTVWLSKNQLGVLAVTSENNDVESIEG